MKETLSAWMDGELSGAQVAQLPLQLKRDEELRRNWDCYHVIGDALRGVHGRDLLPGIRALLEAEPTVLAPRQRSKREKAGWAALSAAASLAAVAFVGWMALPGATVDRAQIASDAAVVRPPIAEVRQVAVPAGEGAKDYLLAHQRYSPSNAMQGVAPYVRTVAEERSSARR